MIKETGDGEGTDAADDGGDGGEVIAGAKIVCDVAFNNAVFAGSASINNGGAWSNHIAGDEARDAGGGDDDIVIAEVHEVVAMVKLSNIIVRVC